MHGPADPRPPAPDFGRVSAEHAQTFIAIVNTLHSEPTAEAFGRLLKKNLEPDDYMLLAHLFEEISVLALHHLIPEALLFDAFAFDLYWDELREDVLALRAQTGNEKFCENFEIAAESFSGLIEPLLDPAYRLAAVMLADRSAAEDAVQEGAIKAWRKVRQLRGDISSLRPWFLSIVANECRMARRTRWWSVIKLADVTAPAADERESH